MGWPGVVRGLRCLVAAVVVLAGLGAVWAQEDAPELDIQAPRVDVSHARRAHRQVEDWLKEGQSSVQPATPIKVTGLFGVRITLRTRGFVIGEGKAYRTDLPAATDQPGPAVDLMVLLAQASEQAMLGVRESLADTELRALLDGRHTADRDKPTIAKVSPRILVDLELGYDLETVRLPPDALEDRVYALFAPAYHGLGFQGGQPGTWAWVWPSEVISRNISPTTQLTLGLKRAGYDREQLPDLAKPDGPGLLRFKDVHMVRPVVDLDPTALVRGKTDLPRFAVSERELEDMSDRLFEHLGRRFTLQDQVLGTYHPTSGRYDPPFADDELIALTCYALTHHSRYLSSTRPKDGGATVFAQRALKVASDLGNQLGEPGHPAEPQVVALVLLTLLETPVADADKALRDRLGNRLVDLVDSGPGEQDWKKATESLVLAALATLYDQTRDPRMGSVVGVLMNHAWNGSGAPNLSALPWLMLAHERVGDLLIDADDSGEHAAERGRRRETIASLIDRLNQRQVIERPKLGPEDVLGGFVLTTGPTDGPPNPDWHNALPLAFLAVALRDEAITQDNDKFGWLLSAGFSARFVGQLMMDETSCYYARDPKAAMGGVRMAPWDNRLALAPTAMSLIALTELQTTLTSLRPGIESQVQENTGGP